MVVREGSARNYSEDSLKVATNTNDQKRQMYTTTNIYTPQIQISWGEGGMKLTFDWGCAHKA